MKTETRRNFSSTFGPVENPFPGLRPFSINESHLFFGREGQSEEVLEKLSENRFVAVIGASGSGKSSLMYCGLVPILYGGFITEAGSRWRIITTRPGNSPVENLADALAKTDQQETEPEDINLQKSVTQAILMRSSLGLVECIKQLKLKPDENILLMVDQFEELFRYRASRKDFATYNESEGFVKLLVEAVRQKEVPVFIVLTMRSDFIGDCSQFQELTGLINNSNYLIPQMTRDDFRDAILGPVAVGGAKIDTGLVQQLLNEVGDNPDQLPILQHALMRTWDYWKQLKDPEKPIGLTDYEAIGKMEKALSEHANEAYDELTPEGKGICESLFKTLTEKGADNRGIRHPTRIEVIASIAKSSGDKVIEVVERFRTPDRSFVTPSSEIPLNEDSVIDLSHESLMRIWNKLKVWVDEEATGIQMYGRLSEASAMYQEGKTSLWRPPDLQLALNWRKKQQPTLAWAERYNPAFERAMVYLETSEKEYEAEEANKIRMQKRALRRTRITALVMGAAAILSLGFMLWAFIQQAEAEKQRSIALDREKEANEQRSIAETKTVEAEESAALALQREKEATREKEIADSARQVATEQEREARRQEGIALTNAEEAKRQEGIAVANADTARINQLAAEKASDEAFERRMLSIAQSMAVKSLQIDQDTSLKGLLAYHAFLFNDKYGGAPYNADIFSGIYNALKTIDSSSYAVFKGHSGSVNSIVFKPGSTLFYSAGSDGNVFQWDLQHPENEFTTIVNNNTINGVIAVSPDGRWLACGTDNLGLQLFDLTTGNFKLTNLRGHEGKIKSIAFFPDSRNLISSGIDKKVLLWNIQTGKAEPVWQQDEMVQSLSVSPDGNTIAAGTKNGKIVLLSGTNWGNVQELFYEENNPVYVVRFNNAGNILISGDLAGNVKQWNWKEMNLIESLRGHTARIQDIQFSPDDKQIATASTDGTIQIWEADDLQSLPIAFGDNEGYVLTIAFSPDGQKLVAGSRQEDYLIARPTKTFYMTGNICNQINRNFTQDEWNGYVGSDIDYEETCKIISQKIKQENE
jgi:energy-coupling factor transporter ATP-binding protein EcfA2